MNTMTVKEATKKMLFNIKQAYIKENNYNNIPNKKIAEKLQITPVQYSRLSTGTATPSIYTWAKICIMHRYQVSELLTNKIIEEMEENNNVSGTDKNTKQKP